MNLEIYKRLLAGEALLAPLKPRALWRLTGPDAERYLNGQVSNDVTKLQNGSACYAAVCTAKGRMEGDVSIARHANDFYLDADVMLRESLGARLDKYLIADDALFEDVSEEWQLTHVFGAGRPSIPANGFAISYARFGLPGHDVWLPASDAPLTGESIDPEVLETLRLEHAIPRWGAELSASTLPPEAGPHMLASISYTKGCYVGQETIARLKSVGHVNRTLVFLRSGTGEYPMPDTKIWQEGREVGRVTSSDYSPRLEQGIALAYVQRPAAVEGTQLQTDSLKLTVAAPLSPAQKI